MEGPCTNFWRAHSRLYRERLYVFVNHLLLLLIQSSKWHLISVRVLLRARVDTVCPARVSTDLRACGESQICNQVQVFYICIRHIHLFVRKWAPSEIVQF